MSYHLGERATMDDEEEGEGNPPPLKDSESSYANNSKKKAKWEEAQIAGIHINPNDTRSIKTTKVPKTLEYCIVWTPIPCITWFLPCIGHMGICTSDGIIHDFAGPYYISIDDFAFGAPHKYVRLNVDHLQPAQYDNAVLAADASFRKQVHLLCW